MLKLSENPPALSPGVDSLTELEGRWYVAHARARAEKALAWDLHTRGISYFLPMVERVRKSGGRNRRVLLPLFSPYVFFCGDSDDRYAAMTTNRICQVIEVADRQRFVTELAAIEQALNGKAELDLYPHIAVGQRCRVTAGPLDGVEGIVIQRLDKARFVLQVNFISTGAVLEVDADILEEL